MDLLIWLTWELLGKIHRSILLRETFFARLGVQLRKNVSQILALIDFFSSREITGKTLSARKNIIGNITLSQTSCLSLNKFGVGHYIPDCRSAHHSHKL